MIPLYMIVEQNNQFVSMDGIDRFTFLIIVLASRRREFNEDFNVDRFYNLVSFT
jgi:hypothetical protein